MCNLNFLLLVNYPKQVPQCTKLSLEKTEHCFNKAVEK